MSIVPPGEPSKSLAEAERLYDDLVARAADRHTLIVALGGGVVGDLAGFVAATFARGLPLVMVPTTLLAQVDSSVGGKVGVNHPRGKNLIGAFYQPAGVWIDTSTLESLPDREFRCGLAEVVKYGVIAGESLFSFLELNAERILARETNAIEHIILESCRIKAGVVSRDEREEGTERAMLNFGHTIGHAIEAVAGYDGPFQHGEAVAVGMVAESRLAERLGWISSDIVDRQVNLLGRMALPVRASGLDLEKLIAGDEPRQEESPGTDSLRPAAFDRKRGVDRDPATTNWRTSGPFLTTTFDGLSSRESSLAESEADLQLIDLIQLTSVPGVGPQTFRALLERFGSAGGVLSASRNELATVSGVGPKLARKIEQARAEIDATKELALCRRLGVRIVARGESEYPTALENIPDPPALLYVKGTIESRDELAIALVGSRRCTPYGARMAERLAGALARTGFTIVSGLARGVDAAAHRGALGAGGRSIGVLANGLSSIYPPEHEDLARAMALSGALVSRDADAADSVAGALHPAKQDHFRDCTGGGGGRSHAAQRLAFDRASCDGAEPRGLRRAWPGGQSFEPGLSSSDPRWGQARGNG